LLRDIRPQSLEAIMSKTDIPKKYKINNETITVEGYGHTATLVFNMTHVIGLQVVVMSINQ
jgi:glutamate dehydrogenase/leucine dehydrogenase